MIKYEKEIRDAAERYNLNYLMVVSIVKAESNFKANAISHCGAKGLMQLMPKTDLWLDDDVDGFDVEGNLDNGCLYLDWLRKYFYRKYDILKGKDDINFWKIVWASYNAGQGNIRKALKKSIEENKDSWFIYENWIKYLKDFTGENSKETIDYVKKIEKFWNEYKEKEEVNSKEDILNSLEKIKQEIKTIENKL